MRCAIVCHNTGNLYKSKLRRDTMLLAKNDFQHIRYMRRRNFVLAPCIA